MEEKVGPVPDAGGDVAPEPESVPGLSPARQRFETCRWRQAAEDATPAHCTHRDVAPMAGTNGFDPEAWCADCAYYKVRRTPRKRPTPPPSDRYYY
jgi:hypothetical protein